MAAIEKRIAGNGKVSYRVKVRIKGFPPETGTFDKLKDAQDWSKKVESDIKAGKHFGQSKRHTFGDLVDEYKPHAKDLARLEYWRNIFGADRLDTVTAARISKERDKLLAGEVKRFSAPSTGNPEADATRQRAKRSGGTVNRYLSALSSCLTYGVKPLGWLEKNPCQAIKKPSENKGRVRFLSEEELARLLAACKPHPTLYLAVVLALSTGARQEEVMGMRWGQIDFSRKVIILHDTKNGDKRALPLVGEAFALLQERAKVRDIKDDRVFPPSERAEKADRLNLRKPWEKALETANIKDFRWHDLRHTAASYLVMSSVSLVEVAKILGHRTLTMVARYAHLADDHIVEAGHKLATRLGI